MKTARIELLTPDLDTTVRFVPGYDLCEKTALSPDKKVATPEQVAAIALALWDMSAGESAPKQSRWALAQQEFYRGA
jgi:hypothetical protein